MGTVTRSSFGKPLVLVRSTTTLAADAASNLIPIWSSLGYGVVRVYVESDVAGTLSIWQKERSGVFRQTDSLAIAAATGTSAEFLIVGEYVRVRYLNSGTVQARMALLASLHP